LSQASHYVCDENLKNLALWYLFIDDSQNWNHINSKRLNSKTEYEYVKRKVKAWYRESGSIPNHNRPMFKKLRNGDRIQKRKAALTEFQIHPINDTAKEEATRISKTLDSFYQLAMPVSLVGKRALGKP